MDEPPPEKPLRTEQSPNSPHQKPIQKPFAAESASAKKHRKEPYGVRTAVTAAWAIAVRGPAPVHRLGLDGQFRQMLQLLSSNQAAINRNHATEHKNIITTWVSSPKECLFMAATCLAAGPVGDGENAYGSPMKIGVIPSHQSLPKQRHNTPAIGWPVAVMAPRSLERPW